jgi:hypothetical protein
MAIVRSDLPHSSPVSQANPVSAVAFRLLLEAYACARDLGCDLWEFAVEIETLRGQGVTNNQLRWLLRKGYIAQAVERTKTHAPQRSFRHLASPRLYEQACFVITDAGIAFTGGEQLQPLANKDAKRVATQPVWDGGLRELRLGEILVKRFKQPAGNQELILGAFQEEGWPARIDDPLPPVKGQDGKRRLHSTISNLNRRQENSLIHFHGGGNGKSVCWRLVHAASDSTAKTERV